jgi:uncharacterized membrane protein
VKRTAVLSLLVAAVAAGVASAATGPPTGTVTGRVLVNPLSIELLVPSGPVNAGKNFKVHATVTNDGPVALQNVSVTLVAPSSLTLRNPATQRVPRLSRGNTATLKWTACATVAGGYVVLARAATGPFVAESTSQLIQIAPARRPTC